MNLNSHKIKLSTQLKCLKENCTDFIHSKSTKLEFEQKEIVHQLKEKGYFIKENYASLAECKELSSSIDKIIEEYKGIIWVDEHLSDHRIFGAENAAKSVVPFYENSWLRQIGESMIGCELENYMTLAARLEAKNENQGSGGGWHRDSTYEHQYKTILYLNDVTEENGPFQYVPYSHKTKNVLVTSGFGVNNNRYEHTEVEHLVNENRWDIKTMKGSAGTLICVDTKGLHRGMPINSGIRYALTNYYIGKYKRDRFEQYFKSMKKQTSDFQSH